jgi:hypothetical protein
MSARTPPTVPTATPPARSIAELVTHARFAIGMTQRALGPLLGSSHRTAERWGVGQARPSNPQLATLAGHVYPRDPALAAELAAAAGQSLESLGLGVPAAAPGPPPAPSPQLLDSVVCQAAEAMDVSPRAMRVALRAAFARARELGLDVAAVADALSPPAPTPAAPAKRARAR